MDYRFAHTYNLFNKIKFETNFETINPFITARFSIDLYSYFLGEDQNPSLYSGILGGCIVPEQPETPLHPVSRRQGNFMSEDYSCPPPLSANRTGFSGPAE